MSDEIEKDREAAREILYLLETMGVMNGTYLFDVYDDAVEEIATFITDRRNG